MVHLNIIYRTFHSCYWPEVIVLRVTIYDKLIKSTSYRVWCTA